VEALNTLDQIREYLSSPSSDFAREVLLRTSGTPNGQVILKDDGSLGILVRKSGRPTLASLRAQAETLGVDISHLGRKTKAILHFLEEASSKTSKISPDEQITHSLPAKGGFMKFGDGVSPEKPNKQVLRGMPYVPSKEDP